MHSPTGYYATFLTVDDESEHRATYPILHWNGDGQPVIADGEGCLVTCAARHRLREEMYEGDDGVHLTWWVSPHLTWDPT